MQIILTPQITETDKEELFHGLRQYNNQFINTEHWRQFGVYGRNESGVMTGGLIAAKKGL